MTRMSRTTFNERFLRTLRTALFTAVIFSLLPTFAHAQWGWGGGGDSWDSWDSGYETSTDVYDLGDSVSDSYEVWDIADTSSDIGEIADIGSDTADFADLGSDMFDVSSSVEDLGFFDQGLELGDAMSFDQGLELGDAMNFTEYTDLGFPGESGLELPSFDAETGLLDNISLEDIGDLVDYGRTAEDIFDFFSDDREDPPMNFNPSEFDFLDVDPEVFRLSGDLELPELPFPLETGGLEISDLADDFFTNFTEQLGDIAQSAYDHCQSLVNAEEITTQVTLPDTEELPDLEEYYEAIIEGILETTAGGDSPVEVTAFEDLSVEQLASLTELLTTTLPGESLPDMPILLDAPTVNTSNQSDDLINLRDIQDAAETANDVMNAVDTIDSVVGGSDEILNVGNSVNVNDVTNTVDIGDSVINNDLWEDSNESDSGGWGDWW